MMLIQDATWGNRHVKSGASGGKPDDAIGYAGEGNCAVLGKGMVPLAHLQFMHACRNPPLSTAGLVSLSRSSLFAVYLGLD